MGNEQSNPNRSGDSQLSSGLSDIIRNAEQLRNLAPKIPSGLRELQQLADSNRQMLSSVSATLAEQFRPLQELINNVKSQHAALSAIAKSNVDKLETSISNLQKILIGFDPAEYQRIRSEFIGSNGQISSLLKQLGKLPPEERKVIGQLVNGAKKEVESVVDTLKTNAEAVVSKPKKSIDVTMPGIRHGVGRRHPLMQTMEELKSVLIGLGFRYDDYPEVETESYNFDSLNTPSWHPSRDMHDSFYTKSGHVLRTHTSAFQTRALQMLKTPPVRAMTSGRCYRRDEIDATHFPIFHQLDVIAVDKSISFSDLKWTLESMLQAILGKDIKLQFRPSYFPFTTPSAEVDVFYRGRWMELLGSGMMRPEVLRNGGIDPDQYQGFAFGIGIDRLTMARFGIDDIRLLYANEEAFLSQF